MTTPVYQVDAFAIEPFTGNPAGVCLVAKDVSDDWMHSVAREMLLAATAFIDTRTTPLRLRWFTPSTELDLCGHATLASAHVLWEEEIVARNRPVTFETRSGLLAGRSNGDLIELDFPSEPAAPALITDDVLSALGVDSAKCVGGGRNRLDLLVELESEVAVRALQPNMSAVAALEGRGVIVTAPSSGEYDFISRFFAPAIGVPEDSVTGSAHCCLGPYWAKRLGRNVFRAYQASARGGSLTVSVNGSRTKLGGQAVLVIRGNLLC